MEKRADVAIIGAGTAGINAMTQVREETNNFVLINGGILGTTCARVGCMPSKILIQVSEDFYRRHKLSEEGISGGRNLTIDVGRVLAHVRTLRDRFVNGIIEELITPLGDKFIDGYAEFISPTLLKVGKTKVRADKIIIATGSRPLIPDHWRLFGNHILTTDTIFEQNHLPDDMAVIGLGAVGLELGLALRRLGFNISGFDETHMIGGLEDPEVNQTAVEIFGKDFPMHLGAEVEIEKQDDRLKIISEGNSIAVDKVLVSIGRIANIDGLHLERIGIDLDSRGMPPFDEKTMQIKNLPIFIAGDADDYCPVLHEAAHEGKVAGYNAVHDPVMEFQRKTPMAVCFTEPNICTVGETWNFVRSRHPAIGSAHFQGGREKIMLQDHGMIRIYADGESGNLLGTEMAAPGGEHLAHLLAWSIQQNLTVFDLLAMPFYHPTIEETLYTALLNLADAVGHKGHEMLGFKI